MTLSRWFLPSVVCCSTGVQEGHFTNLHVFIKTQRRTIPISKESNGEGLHDQIREMPAASEEEVAKRDLILKGSYVFLTHGKSDEAHGTRRSASSVYSYWLGASEPWLQL
jgi:hypothetical protein